MPSQVFIYAYIGKTNIKQLLFLKENEKLFSLLRSTAYLKILAKTKICPLIGPVARLGDSFCKGTARRSLSLEIHHRLSSGI